MISCRIHGVMTKYCSTTFKANRSSNGNVKKGQARFSNQPESLPRPELTISGLILAVYDLPASKAAYPNERTVGIDKSSSSEVSEAINSMFNWYRDSHICYAYLSDVLKEPIESLQDGVVPFEESRWFTRGWTGKSETNLPYFNLGHRTLC